MKSRAMPAMALAGFVTMVDMRVVDPLLPVIAAEYGIGVALAGFMVSAFALPYGVFQLPFGPLGDRFGKLRVMALALGLFALAHLGFAVVRDYWLVVALRFVTGAAAAAIISLCLAHIGDTYPYAERQAAMARYMAWVMLGSVMGGAFGGVASDLIGWRGAFLVLGAVSAVSAALLWRCRLEAPAAPLRGGHAWRHYLVLLGDRPARLVLAAVFVEGACVFGCLGYFGALLRDGFDLPFALIGLLLTGYGLGGLIYSRFAVRLLRRYDEVALMRRGLALLTLGQLAIALLPWWPGFVPAYVVLGFGFYLLHATLQTRSTELAPSARGTAVSLFAFVLFLGNAIGTATIGPAVERFGYGASIAAASLLLPMLLLPVIAAFPRVSPASAAAGTGPARP